MSAWRLLAACALGLALGACVKKPYPAGRELVDQVSIEGNRAVDTDEIKEGLTTHRSPRFLGIWDGVVFDYELFDETLLARDLRRIERLYQSRGYFEAKVTAARVIKVDLHRIKVQIVVQEGPPVITDDVSISGVDHLPLTVATSVLTAIEIVTARPFSEDRYERSKAGIVATLRDQGYPFAEVDGTVSVDLPTHRATIRFAVDPGPISRLGPISIVGLKQIPEPLIRQILALSEGDTYSQAEIRDAQETLAALGVFSRIEILQDRRRPETRTVPLTVQLEESTLRTLTLGVGATADALRLAGNARAGWENRNWLGGLRRLTLDARPGVNLFPARIDNLTGSVQPLPDLRSQLALRQPSFLEARTTGFLRAQFNIVPFLFVYDGDPREVEVLGFREFRFAMGLERPFFFRHLMASASYNTDFRNPFVYEGQALNKDIVASFPELDLTLDFRDNPLQPRKGISISVNSQANNRLLGGTSTDVRVRPEVRAYAPLGRRVVLAGRATYGRLFTLTEPSDPAQAQLLRLIRGFYSGGPGSNRGYSFQGVNPRAPLEVLAERLAFSCSDPRAPRSACLARPIGALELWELSSEVRFPLLGGLGGVVFADTGDVLGDYQKLSFSSPHLSVGPGLRYQTPVGPVRADLGIRVPGLQERVARHSSEERPKDFLGIPAALHLSLGEDF